MLPEPKEEAGTYGSSLSNNPLQRREDRLAGALQAPANKAGDHRGQASPCGRAGAITARSEPASSSPAVPPTCPKQRSVAVADGQQRSVAVAPDLRHCRMARSLTVLPKLAVPKRFVRIGSARHREAVVLGGRERSRAVSKNRRSPHLHAQDFGG
jgi:hypothetical protein